MKSRRAFSPGKWVPTAVVVALGLALASGCDGCRKGGSDASDAAEPDASMTINLLPRGVTSLTPTPPGVLGKYFPASGAGGYERVMSGEKPGYAEATLRKDGKDVAIASITDAARLAYTRTQFDTAPEKIGDVPVLKLGDDESAAMVKQRFQVKVFSRTLDHEARKAILASFDLAGLGGS